MSRPVTSLSKKKLNNNVNASSGGPSLSPETSQQKYRSSRGHLGQYSSPDFSSFFVPPPEPSGSGALSLLSHGSIFVRDSMQAFLDSLISASSSSSRPTSHPGSPGPGTPGSHSKTKKVGAPLGLDGGHGRLEMDFLEKMRRWKRSLDGFISFRKAIFIAGCALLFLLYVWPSFFNWLLGGPSLEPESYVSHSCMGDKMSTFREELSNLNAHSAHNPWRITDKNYLPYAGNGHLGASTADADSLLYIFGARHLSVPVPFKPLVAVTPDSSHVFGEESVNVVHYLNGMVTKVGCYTTHGGAELSVTQQIYAHRAFPSILVQEVKMANPSSDSVVFNVERLGIAGWKNARSRSKTLEHGDGGQKYVIISGLVPIPADPTTFKMVAIVAKKFSSSTIEVPARMTQTVNIVTAVTYSDVLVNARQGNETLRESLEHKAAESLLQAVGMTSVSLRRLHTDIWRLLWTTGFEISHSMADDVINGHQINATMYFVLSHVPAPIHSLQLNEADKKDMLAQLAYSEGCYGGHPTLLAQTLWKSMTTIEEVNAVVKAWMLTLEKNGCSKLIRAGADGVVQAMVLSFASLKFREDHLELNSHPKDLHRDYFFRRVSYGNATHLNITIEVSDENKPVLYVALDRRDRDYFACDAGCLDPPNKLSTEAKSFPVKLTDPVTAILYITSDHLHMEELKEAIHLREVVEAPAHEHHVIALHRHGNKLGGLPTIFWFSIGFLILVFHAFLFKLIWQEYCSSTDKFRSRKFSDYQ